MTSNSKISETERTLLKYLGLSLKPYDGDCEIPGLNAEERKRIYDPADRHEVLALLENLSYLDGLPEKQRQAAQLKTARTVHKGIKLQALNSRLTALLSKEGVTAVTLKGYAVSRFYPVPEYRKTTDIDLLFFSIKEAEKAVRILCANGFKVFRERQAEHHFVLVSEKKEVVELHTAWADDFMEKRLNKRLKKLQKESFNHLTPIDCDGTTIYAYETAWQGLYLLVHMLQHFVGSGFGLRNLCDWVVLWENCGDEKSRRDFLNLVCESGTAEFAGAVTSACVKYLGLERDKSPIPEGDFRDGEVTDALLRDVLDAGEFGRGESERMVGMDGNSFAAYVKEFHHQMHINFPKAGKVILLWPVLWLATLIRFLHNNKKLNRAPVAAIIKKAGDRGKLVKRLMSNK